MANMTTCNCFYSLTDGVKSRGSCVFGRTEPRPRDGEVTIAVINQMEGKHGNRFLPNTRKDLLAELNRWILNLSSKIIFWLRDKEVNHTLEYLKATGWPRGNFFKPQGQSLVDCLLITALQWDETQGRQKEIHGFGEKRTKIRQYP